MVGVDFKMSPEYTYAFDQSRASGSVKNNNNYYREMNLRFAEFQKHFDKEDFKVYNCNPESGLSCFPHKPFDKAIEECSKNMPPAVLDQFNLWRCKENTQGLYDRKANEKQDKKEKVVRQTKFKDFQEFVSWRIKQMES